ncbi:hypothetical protein GCM10009844_11480 [Nocardioides koreensis]|uniref:Uncharacterized protein n=1 Tax=Nocardioides koreensis TaxID=433651 RepID=A0ABP5L9K8_9ACTN
MLRYVCLTLAVAFGLGAAVLVATSPTVHYGGATRTCSSIIVRAEAGEAGEQDLGTTAPGPVDERLSQACDETVHHWSVLAGLAALLCVAVGSVGLLSGRPDPAEAGLSPG